MKKEGPFKRPTLLLCDEATSALDPLIERSVVEVIDAASRNVTTVMVAHKLQTVVDADLILVRRAARRAGHAHLPAVPSQVDVRAHVGRAGERLRRRGARRGRRARRLLQAGARGAARALRPLVGGTASTVKAAPVRVAGPRPPTAPAACPLAQSCPLSGP